MGWHQVIKKPLPVEEDIPPLKKVIVVARTYGEAQLVLKDAHFTPGEIAKHCIIVNKPEHVRGLPLDAPVTVAWPPDSQEIGVGRALEAVQDGPARTWLKLSQALAYIQTEDDA